MGRGECIGAEEIGDGGDIGGEGAVLVNLGRGAADGGMNARGAMYLRRDGDSVFAMSHRPRNP